jgi:predicted transcriptional regulator of viral defense system
MSSEKSRVKKMARFHLLVDLSLQGNLGAAEQTELADLRKTLDRRDASAAAKLQKQMIKEQTRFDKSMARIRIQVANAASSFRPAEKPAAPSSGSADRVRRLVVNLQAEKGAEVIV